MTVSAVNQQIAIKIKVVLSKACAVSNKIKYNDAKIPLPRMALRSKYIVNLKYYKIILNHKIKNVHKIKYVQHTFKIKYVCYVAYTVA